MGPPDGNVRPISVQFGSKFNMLCQRTNWKNLHNNLNKNIRRLGNLRNFFIIIVALNLAVAGEPNFEVDNSSICLKSLILYFTAIVLVSIMIKTVPQLIFTLFFTADLT